MQTGKFFQEHEEGLKKVINVISILGIIATIIGAIYFWQIGAFRDPKVLEQMVKGHPLAGPILFMLVQIIQVVIPVIPGGVTLAVGVLIFGAWWGFVYNYVGIVLGSIILFYLGRVYGLPLLKVLVSQKVYDKYMAIVEKSQHRYNWVFFIAIVLPIAPDDALVLLSSTTKMSWRFLLFSILLGKIPSIFLYSFFLVHASGWLAKLFGG